MDVSVRVFSDRWRKPPGEPGWWLVKPHASCLVEDVTLYLSDLLYPSPVHLNQQLYRVMEVLGHFPAFP